MLRAARDAIDAATVGKTRVVKRPTGRPSTYTPELAAKVCEAIRDGWTLSQIEAAEGYPTWTAIKKWLDTIPSFHGQYARAYELSAFVLENEALDAVRAAKDSDSASAARALLDGIKWSAGKRNPKVYGEKVQHDVSGEVDVRVTVDQRQSRISSLISKLRAPTIDGSAEPGD